MDYEIDMIIDENALDVEWLNQPSLALKYGKDWAMAADILSRTEEALKITQADLTDKVNQNPDKYLGEGVKPTVGNIESYIIRSELFKEAKENVRQAQYDLNIALIAKNEISNTRKSALENLVKLHGQNYFAGPNVPRDLSYEAAQRQSQKRSDAGVAKTFQRTKK